jgi:hypothetical protein
MSKIDRIFKTNLMIYRGDRAKAKAATRAFLKHLLVIDGLWLPSRKRLYKEV